MANKNVIESLLYKGKVKVRYFPDTGRYTISPGPENKDEKFDPTSRGVTTFGGIKDKSDAIASWATETMAFDLIDKLAKGISEEDILAAQSLYKTRKEEAADLGTAIHDWCERYVRYKLKQPDCLMPDMPEDPNIQIAVNAFLTFFEDQHKTEFLSTERVVYSMEHDFAGKMDIEAVVDGELCVVDLKSSNGLYNGVRMQTAAYLMADKEESKRKYKGGRWALRVAKETEEQYKARMLRKRKEIYDPYKPFEALYFGPKTLEHDFKGFLAAKDLWLWNDSTDFYQVKKRGEEIK